MKDESEFANYKKHINSRIVILLAQAGSEVLGISEAGSSDRDEMGVCIESLPEAVGFSPFEHIIYRTAEDRTGKNDEPSKPGDIDLTIYGLRKYLKLALGGNPNIINLLYTPADKCLISSTIGEGLQKLAPKIVSREAGKAFLGYMRAQRGRLIGERGQKRVNRPELVAKYGYDTKYAMHLIRLGLQGCDLLNTGKLPIPMTEFQIKFLREIKTGKYSLDYCFGYAATLENTLEGLLETSQLQEKPDREAVEKWMLEVYMHAWQGGTW